jgi:hypothetical protein
MSVDLAPRRQNTGCASDHDWSLHEHPAREGYTAMRRCGRCGLTAIDLPAGRSDHRPAHAAV